MPASEECRAAGPRLYSSRGARGWTSPASNSLLPVCSQSRMSSPFAHLESIICPFEKHNFCKCPTHFPAETVLGNPQSPVKWWVYRSPNKFLGAPESIGLKSSGPTYGSPLMYLLWGPRSDFLGFPEIIDRFLFIFPKQRIPKRG